MSFLSASEKSRKIIYLKPNHDVSVCSSGDNEWLGLIPLMKKNTKQWSTAFLKEVWVKMMINP